MVQRQFMLVQLRQDGANVQMSVSLDLRSLQSRLDCQGTLEEVECSAHLSYASIVTGHVIECHGLSKLVVFAELLTLLEQVERAIYVFFLEIVDGQDVTDFAELFARAREFTASRTKVHFLDLKQLL